MKLFQSLWRFAALCCLIGGAFVPAWADGLIHHGPKLDIQIQRGSERLPMALVNRLRQGDRLLVKPVEGSLAKGDWVLMLGRISPAGNEVATQAFDLSRLQGHAELEMATDEQVPVILLAPQLRNLFGLYTSFMESEALLKEVIQSDPQRFYDLQKVDQVNQAITALSQGLDQVVINRHPEQAIASAKALAFRFGVGQIDPECFKGNAVNTQCVAISMVANKDFVLPASSDLGQLVGSRSAADLTKFLSDKLGIVADARDFLSHKFRDQYDFATTFGRPLADSGQIELFSLARFRSGNVKTAYVYVPAWFKAPAPTLSADPSAAACFMDDEWAVQVSGRLPVANYWHDWTMEVMAADGETLLRSTDVRFHSQRGVFTIGRPHPVPASLASRSSVLVRLSGRFGFDAVSLPAWNLAMPFTGDLSGRVRGVRTLVAGDRGDLSLDLGQAARCVQGMTLSMADRVLASAGPEAAQGLPVDLGTVSQGAATLTVRMKGAPAQSMPLKVQAPRARVLSVEHAELDEDIVVSGTRLDRIAALQWEGALCLPRELRRSVDSVEQLSLSCNVDIRSHTHLPSSVLLQHKDGEPDPIRMRLQKNPAAPRVALAASAQAVLVRPSSKALQWGLKPQDGWFSEDSSLSLLLQTVEGYVPTRGAYTLQLRFVDDPVTAKKPISAPLMVDPSHKELRTRQPVRFKGVELPSVVNPLEYRVVHEATGLTSRWAALNHAVLMLPEITSLSCAPQVGRIWLHGTQLDLIDAARFADAASTVSMAPAVLEPCPDGLCLALPAPARQHRLHLSLRWVNRVFQVDLDNAADCPSP